MPSILSEGPSIYLQIAERIENNILRDILLEDEQVPSTNELARLYTINPATAAKGLGLLADEGILYKKRGLGMFVAQGAKQMVQKKRKAVFVEQYVKPLAVEAQRLEISSDELERMLQEAQSENPKAEE